MTCFSQFELCCETQAGYIFSFLAYKTLKSIVTYFFSVFFQSSFSDRKSISFQIYLLMKDLIFVILSECFHISSWFNVTVTAYWRIYHIFYWGDLLLLFCFLSNQENLYMIHYDSDLFSEIYNTIDKHNQRKTHYLSLIPNCFWYLFLSELKSSFITSSASSLIMISVLSLFEWITHSSSLSMEEIKLFAIVNWIFHVSDFLRLFMMSFKYGLILLRYSSTDSVLLYHLNFHI